MMGKVTISNPKESAFTAVSNLFLDEYMADANDAQIKVYLYLLRRMNAGLSTSISGIADQFNHTEKDVERALRYWDKKGLIRLIYDEAGNLTSIHMEDLPAKGKQAEVVTQVSYSNVASATASVEAPVSQKKEPAISDQRFPELSFLAEQYFGRTLSPNDINVLTFIQKDLGYTFELADYLLQYCAGLGKTDYRYVQKVAISWAEKKISTPEEAAARSGRFPKHVYAVMKLLGLTGAPTEPEAAMINPWFDNYGFSMDIVTEACNRTVLNAQTNRLKYANGILTDWHNVGVTSLEDIAALDKAHETEKKSVSIQSGSGKNGRRDTSPSRTSRNSFNQFQQNNYDFDALEQVLLKKDS